MSVHQERTERPPLSLLLRRETSAKHRLAEDAPFVRSLLAGRVARCVYARFVESLYFVYSELERALDRHGSHPIVAPLDVPELRRVYSLEVDLSTWVGPCWRGSVSPSAATRAYAERIRAVADEAPVLLVGHLYTRYLGDLSGGQLLGRAVERTFGPSASVAFYRFGPAAERARLKALFRAHLDAVPIDAATSVPVVAEACRVFDHNTQLFDELARP